MKANRFLVRLGAVLLVSCALLLVQSAKAQLTLQFASLTNSLVTFSGGAFTFGSTNGYQFDITAVQNGVGDSVGLNGYVSPGGPFTIGVITISGPIQSAPVTGSGTLYITDAQHTNLTGSITWIDITTVGTGGILDLNGTVNLTGITYPGTNNDLGALAAAGSASDVVTFQFVPAKSLTTLKSQGGVSSYSGAIVVPEPSTVTLVGLGLMGLLALSRRRR